MNVISKPTKLVINANCPYIGEGWIHLAPANKPIPTYNTSD